MIRQPNQAGRDAFLRTSMTSDLGFMQRMHYTGPTCANIKFHHLLEQTSPLSSGLSR